MAVRVSGPGSPFERYQGKQVASGGQTTGPFQTAINPSKSNSGLVEAGALAALSQVYGAAEAAIVRLGRGLRGGNDRSDGGKDSASGPFERRRALSAGVVSMLLDPFGELDEVAHKGGRSGSAGGRMVDGDGEGDLAEKGDEVGRVAAMISLHIKGNRDQALQSHGG